MRRSPARSSHFWGGRGEGKDIFVEAVLVSLGGIDGCSQEQWGGTEVTDPLGKAGPSFGNAWGQDGRGECLASSRPKEVLLGHISSLCEAPLASLLPCVSARSQ